MNIKWEDCKIEFAHDGALRDVQVIDATADDWREVFDFISGGASVNQLLSFISGIGRRLGKTVLVFHEGWEMSPFLKYDPEANEVNYLRG